MSTFHLTKKQRSLRSEKELAKQVNGRRQPASGALPVAALKGDVKTADFLFDDKVTQAKSYAIKTSDWEKLRKQAFQARRKPVMRINFDEGPTLFIVSQELFFNLTQNANNA